MLAALDERLLPGHLRALLGGSFSSEACDISANQASHQATTDSQFVTVTLPCPSGSGSPTHSAPEACLTVDSAAFCRYNAW